MKTSTYFLAGKNNFSHIGDNFKLWFSDMYFIIPKKAKLLTQTLPRYMDDKFILEELKPEEVNMGDVAYFLKSADKNDCYIFHVKDVNGVLRAVSVFWFGDGWNVYAHEDSDLYKWDAGNQVVSRNFGTLTVGNSDPSEITINEVRYKLTKI